MTIYLRDGKDTIIDDVRLGMCNSIFENEMVIEIVGGTQARIGMTAGEAIALIRKLSDGLARLNH